jgi:hypothetical protein
MTLGLALGIIMGGPLERLLPWYSGMIYCGIALLLVVASAFCWLAYSKAKTKEQDQKRSVAAGRPAQDGAPAQEATQAQKGTPGQ